MIVRCGEQTFSGVRAIIFDKDGTLGNVEAFLQELGRWRSHFINTHIPGIAASLQQAFGCDRHLHPGGLLAVGTRRENEIAAAAYVAATGRDWIEALEIVHAAFVSADCQVPRKADATPVFAGVLELLERLQTAGLQLALLSSDSPENVQDFVRRYALEPYFSVLRGAEGAVQKPDPALIYQICEILGVSPQEVLVVGDAQSDLKMGQSAGVKGCIGAIWGWNMAPHLPDADVLVRQCTEIQVPS